MRAVHSRAMPSPYPVYGRCSCLPPCLPHAESLIVWSWFCLELLPKWGFRIALCMWLAVCGYYFARNLEESAKWWLIDLDNLAGHGSICLLNMLSIRLFSYS
ncbi:hypothetical protein U1Q18_052660 [Sarracenia purpurea var. burkii]